MASGNYKARKILPAKKGIKTEITQRNSGMPRSADKFTSLFFRSGLEERESEIERKRDCAYKLARSAPIRQIRNGAIGVCFTAWLAWHFLLGRE